MAPSQSAAPAMTLYINVHREIRRSDHVITLNRRINGSKALNDKLSAIGSNGLFTCGFGATVDGKTIIQMVVLSGKQEQIYARKLRDIVELLRDETNTDRQDVIIHVEKAIMTTLSELEHALDSLPTKNDKTDIFADFLKDEKQ